jgi:hypothetical protein
VYASKEMTVGSIVWCMGVPLSLPDSAAKTTTAASHSSERRLL